MVSTALGILAVGMALYALITSVVHLAGHSPSITIGFWVLGGAILLTLIRNHVKIRRAN